MTYLRYRRPRSTCAVCGGIIHDRGIFSYQDTWLHLYEEDWVDNPHNAEPVVLVVVAS